MNKSKYVVCLAFSRFPSPYTKQLCMDRGSTFWPTVTSYKITIIGLTVSKLRSLRPFSRLGDENNNNSSLCYNSSWQQTNSISRTWILIQFPERQGFCYVSLAYNHRVVREAICSSDYLLVIFYQLDNNVRILTGVPTLNLVSVALSSDLFLHMLKYILIDFFIDKGFVCQTIVFDVKFTEMLNISPCWETA